MLKKINAVLALITSAMIVDHTTACGILMILDKTSESKPVPARILMTLVIIHFVISMLILTVFGDGVSNQHASLYKRTIAQRIGGILMLPIAFVHTMTIAAGGMPFVISHILLVVTAMMHTAISIPNALVTLGVVRSTKSHKIVFIISSIVCGLLTVVGLAGSVMAIIRIVGGAG